jgi:protein-S-isoprenylcysteine O-methyltransferase Ste14
MMSAVTPLVHVLYDITVAVWLIVEVRQGRARRFNASSADQGSRSVLRACQVVAIIGAISFRIALPSADIGSGDSIPWVGLILMWCGIGLRFWSFQTLGQYFTFTVQTSEDQPVVSTGPYRVIRHPGYAAVLVSVVGLGLIFGNWASLAILTSAFATGLIYRIKVEEAALSRDLGGRYQAYANTRKRLIPFVW